MGNNDHRKKKSLLIYPSFQLRLIAFNALIMLIAFGFMAFQVQRVISHLKNLGANVSLTPDHPYFKFIDFQSNRLYLAVLIAFLASAIISSFLTLRLSHRLAGPITRLRYYFIKLSQTDVDAQEVEPLKFREKDYFMDLPPIINAAVRALHKKSQGKGTAA